MDAFNLFFALAKFNQQINSAKCRATFLQGRLKANLRLFTFKTEMANGKIV